MNGGSLDNGLGGDQTTFRTADMVFICGPSRSGTSLLRGALNRHPDIHIAGETHYFDDLRIQIAEPASLRLSGALKQKASSYFLRISHRPYGHNGKEKEGRIEEFALNSFADRLGGSADAFFYAFCSLSGGSKPKKLLGEKTPRHIFRIDEIKKAFPHAKVICMIRDPRAVVASYGNWKNQGGFDLDKDPEHSKALAEEERRTRASYHPITIGLLWRAQINSAIKAKDTYGPGDILHVRYEDVIDKPEDEIKRVCEFLGIEYSNGMLDVPMHNSSFSGFDRSSGISKGNKERWRENLSNETVFFTQTLCQRGMEVFDYSKESGKKNVFRLLYLVGSWPVSICKAIKNNSSRMGSLPSYIMRRIKLVIAK